MLLDLPPEILEMVLLELGPDSFSIILMTCKTIRTFVLASPNIIRNQLMRVPGLRCHDGYTNEELLKKFLRRAERSGWNGIDVFGDIVSHRPLISAIDRIKLPKCSTRYREDDLWTRPRINLVQRCCQKGCEHGTLASAADYEGAIHIYKIRHGTIRPFCVFDPHSLNLDDDENMSRIQYRCVAMRWQRCNNSHLDHMVALFSYRIKGFTGEGTGQYANKFVKEAGEKAEKTLKLCVWCVDAYHEGNQYLMKICKTYSRPAFACEVICHPFEKPVLLATTEDYSQEYTIYPVAVVFHSPIGYRISVYQLSNMKAIHVPVLQTDSDGKETVTLQFLSPVSRAEFSHGPRPELLLFGRDSAPLDRVHGCVQSSVSLKLESALLGPRTEPNLFSTSASPVCFRGVPLYSMHDHETGLYASGSKYCIHTIIELVIPRTTINGVYLIKYVEQQDSCQHYDLSLELPAMEHIVLAKFLGSETPGARIIAFAKSKQRIAIADWDTIRIYDLFAQAFLKPYHGSVRASAGKFSGMNRARKYELPDGEDEAYTSRCGHGYYHDFLKIKGSGNKRIVGIKPVELPKRGVVFSMAFAKSDVLWAWTNRGLVKWSWGGGKDTWREEIPFGPVPDNMYLN